MQGDSLTILLFGAGAILSVLGWLLRQRVSAQEQENKRLATECERNEQAIQDLQREQRNLVTRQELEEYKRDTGNMIDALRAGIKVDLENIRRNEIRELHEIIREETRLTRAEMREDIGKLTHALQDQIRTLHHNMRANA